MRLTIVLQRFVELVRDTNPHAAKRAIVHSDEQRDESSMADFVRILQKHDNR